MSLWVFASFIEFLNVFMNCIFEAISLYFVEMIERLFYNHVSFSGLSVKQINTNQHWFFYSKRGKKCYVQLKFGGAFLNLGCSCCFGIMYKSNNIFDLSDDCFPKERIESCLGFSYDYRASPVAQMVKNLPTMWETCVWSLGWEDLLEKEGMSTHSSIIGKRMPMDRRAWQAIVHGVAKSRTWCLYINLSREIDQKKKKRLVNREYRRADLEFVKSCFNCESLNNRFTHFKLFTKCLLCVTI